MGIDFTLQEILKAIREIFGIYIPEKLASFITIIIAALIIIPFIYKVLKFLFRLITNLWKYISSLFYSREEKDFVEIRNLFIQHLVYEVQRLNREADWNDFHYTTLEAEVDIDPAIEINIRNINSLPYWLLTRLLLIKNIFRSPVGKTAKDLVSAIMRSKSRAFLVIGDPGSGKTVSLRHLFLRLGEKSVRSNNKSAQIPIYLNLKQFNVAPNDANAVSIHDWIITQLKEGQDRTIFNFVEENFETLLLRGDFFFIFDSFDEIPAVMDANEEEEVVVRQYAKALDDFLHSSHRSRGLVSSRPYRAPKVFLGQRMNIRALSIERLKTALGKYMSQKRQLAHRIWHELVRERYDLLRVIQTPFYLALLVRYIEDEEKLPDRHYELFEEFVVNRADSDQERLKAFGFTPKELLDSAGKLSYLITATPHLGLEATINQIQETGGDWKDNQLQSLLSALHFSKLGRLSPGRVGESQIFSFVHRRFHEYFVARYLLKQSDIMPMDAILADNRWREVLVLLCEVLPGDQLDKIVIVAKSALKNGIDAISGTKEHSEAIQALRFLKDGFRSRLNDLPNDIRILASQFIERQIEVEVLDHKLFDYLKSSPIDLKVIMAIIHRYLANDQLKDILLKNPPNSINDLTEILKTHLPNEDSKANRELLKLLDENPNNLWVAAMFIRNQLTRGNLLDEKRAIEGIGICDDQSMSTLLEIALSSESVWLREIAIKSCRALTVPTEQIKKGIRKHLFLEHRRPSFFRDYSFYKILFSSPSQFYSLFEYTRMLQATYLISLTMSMISVIFAINIIANLAPQAEIFNSISFISLLIIFGIGIERNLRSGVYPSGSLLFANAVTPIFIFILFYKLIFLLPIIVVYECVIFLEALLLYFVNHYPYTPKDWLLLPYQLVLEFYKGLGMIWKGMRLTGKAKIIETLKIYVMPLIITVPMLYIVLPVFAPIISRCGVSLYCIYATNNLLVATLYTLICLIFLIILLLLIIGLVVLVFKIPVWLWEYIIKQPIILRRLSLDPATRPNSLQEAMEIFQKLKGTSSKIEFIHLLQRWYPVSLESDFLKVEADKCEGVIRDEFYKLIEIWENLKGM